VIYLYHNIIIILKHLLYKKNDKSKKYSIIEPHIYCICKGKINLKYEFRTKVSILRTLSSIILSIISFDEKLNDLKTIQPHLNYLTSRNLLLPNNIVGDTGYRGRKYYGDTTVVTSIKNIFKLLSEDLKLHVKMMNKRSSIEQTISHMKNEFRLGHNELRGIIGDKINILLCATGSNFTKFVRLEKQKVKNSLLNNKKRKKLKKK
jgi:IS5 family transposase